MSHVITVGTPPREDMAWLFTLAAQFFEQDASDERKAVWRDNLAKLPPGTPVEQSFPAQAPLRFFNAHTDMASAYQDAQVKPALLAHLRPRKAVARHRTPGRDLSTTCATLCVSV